MVYLSFIEYLRQCQKVVNFKKYERDIQYRCVLFHQYHRQYRNHCEQLHVMHQFDDIQYEVQQFEKRMQEYYDRLGT